MSIKEKNSYRSAWKHHDKFYFEEVERNYKDSEKQAFVVPWQMIIRKEKGFLIK